MDGFKPQFTITNRMTQAITRIERARGFMEAACLPSGPHRQAQLSADWVREVGEQALILEAHHTTHIEGTRLTLDQAERLWKGEAVPEADPDDARELLNYRTAFEFVSECLASGLPASPLMIVNFAFTSSNARMVLSISGNRKTSRRDWLNIERKRSSGLHPDCQSNQSIGRFSTPARKL